MEDSLLLEMLGVECAQGEFICFIDSDDWIELDYIEVLLNGMENTNVDISVIQMIKVKDFNKIAFKVKAKLSGTYSNEKL